MTNKRRLYIGVPLAIVFSPVMLAGYAAGIIARYFRSGYKIEQVVNGKLEKYLEKFDDR